MLTLEQLRDWLLARVPAAQLTILPNPAPSAQHSLLVDSVHAREIAILLRDDRQLRFDQCSNVTGLDFPEREVVDVTKTTIPDANGGPDKIIEQKTKRLEPGYLEAVYHLYSIALRHGPLILRLRTRDRRRLAPLPSLTPVWRSCEFQEREIYDLFGIAFDGHPDLRRLLMWDEFEDFPLRKDYVAPSAHEWEPTPHGDVLTKARVHYSAKTELSR